MRNSHRQQLRNPRSDGLFSCKHASAAGVDGLGNGVAEDGAADDQPPIRKHSPSLRTFLTLLVVLAAIAWIPLPSAAAVINAAPTRTISTRLTDIQSHGSDFLQYASLDSVSRTVFSKRQASATPTDSESRGGTFVVEAIMIPVLVLLSGIFAGLTLGYMSLDMNQLQVIAKTGTPRQRRDAERIIPLRKNGHLLLVSLLICNMAASETLPVVADPVLGGGLQAVIVSTVLVIIFSEIIPQSVCSRFGLQIGAFMVWPTRIVIGLTYIISWPVSKLLEWALGAHSGVVYRRAELKELIAMHGDAGEHGGDLNRDTVTIVGATLDLQEKVVRDAMTPSDKVFMLSIESRLDYSTLTKILKSGHSRIPVFEELEVLQPAAEKTDEKEATKRKRIIGALLTKQLILLDPEDAVPLKELPINPIPTVAENMPLLHILNTFQEGRSHLAMVARAPEVFQRERSNSNASTSTAESGNFFSRLRKTHTRSSAGPSRRTESIGSASPERERKGFFRGILQRDQPEKQTDEETAVSQDPPKDPLVQTEKEVDFLHVLDRDDIVGLITLEDVLEEMIGEEIEDEFDFITTGRSAAEPYIPAEAKYHIANTSGARKGFSLPMIPLPAPFVKATGHPSVSFSTNAADNGVLKMGDGTPVTGSNAPKTGPLETFKRTTFGMVRSASAPAKKRNPTAVLEVKKDKTEPVVNEKPADLPQKSPSALPPAAESTDTAAVSSAELIEGVAKVSSPAAVEPEPPANEMSEQTSSPEAAEESSTHHRRRLSLDDQQRAEGKVSPEAPQGEFPKRGRSGTLGPLLSDALLLEKGRRQLRAQGQDPANLNIRVLSRSVTPADITAPRSGRSTPRLETPSGGNVLVIPPPGTLASSSGTASTSNVEIPHGALAPAARKQTFKSPGTPAANIPVRPATKNVRTDYQSASDAEARLPDPVSSDKGKAVELPGCDSSARNSSF